MTDSNDDDRGRDGNSRPRGRPDRGRSSADRPFRRRHDDDRPFHGRPDDRRRDRPGGGRPRDREEQSEPAAEPAEERIAKVIARAGVASRRDAEAMIAEGRVTLNGEVLASPAVNVTPQDKITVDGEPLPAKERTRLWIFHKPRGLVTTARDPEGRPTVFESLPDEMPRVVAVGRLDINTEGLLLLTNDGGLARVIAHPDTGWMRRYKVRAHGDITQADLDPLARGLTVNGIEYGPVEARLDRVQGDNVWITLGLREGKNREIKNILEHLGLRVNRLIRTSFGPFQLGDLEPGLVEEVKTKVLQEQLGTKLAEAAGVDFTSPVREPIAPFGSPKRERSGQDERAPRGRPDRGGRPDWSGRGKHFGGQDEGRRPSDRFHRGSDERPFRTRDDEQPARGRRGDSPARERSAYGERRSTVWRADEAERDVRRGPKAPRRGEDPKQARTERGARPHQRVGAIEGTEGRKVVVERLVSEPKPDTDRPARRPPGPGDRPRRREDRSFGDRPPRDRGEGPRGQGRGEARDSARDSARDGDRPARGRGDERGRAGPPRNGRPGGSRPSPRGGASPHGGPKPRSGPPRGGSSWRGGPKGPR